MNTSLNRVPFFLAFAGIALVTTSCVDDFLPESLDAFDKESVFTQTVYQPQLGRTSVISNNFNAGNSTLPFTFEITRIERFDGSEAPELTQYFPVKVWKTPYLGTETSLEQIEAKRAIEYRPLFQVRKHSGEMVMWRNANSSFVLCEPDSCYRFDVLVKNSGGYAYTTNMRLVPVREADYEPNTIDLKTGLDTVGYVRPTLVSGMRDAATGFLMREENVRVYFRKNEEHEGGANTLTFRFYREDYTPIDPSSFNLTDWAGLVHGFDLEKTDEYVRYKVAYPVPLLESVSRFTNPNGDMARVTFAYDRISPSGYREQSAMQFDFSIFKEGHWEILFVFDGNGPLFKDRVRGGQ